MGQPRRARGSTTLKSLGTYGTRVAATKKRECLFWVNVFFFFFFLMQTLIENMYKKHMPCRGKKVDPTHGAGKTGHLLVQELGPDLLS